MKTRRQHLTCCEFLIFVIVVLLIGFIFPTPSKAGDATLSWTAPVGQETCAPAGDLTDLAGVRIYQLIGETTDPAVTEYVVTGLKGGEHTFAATAYTATGSESKLSSPALKTVEPLKVIDERAYVVAKINDAFLTVVAGTVPIGIPCSETQSVNDLHVVPAAAVAWTATVQDVLVVAKCQ